MKLRSGRVLKKKYVKNSWLPFELQRKIFLTAHPSVFIEADDKLQRYMIRYNLLSKPTHCLAWAVSQKNKDLVKYMIQKGIEPDEHVYTIATKYKICWILEECIKEKNVLVQESRVKTLISESKFIEAEKLWSSDMNINDSYINYTHIMSLEDIHQVEALQRIFPDSRNILLYYAAQYSRKDIFRFAFETGGRGMRWGGVVWDCLFHGNLESAKLLIDSGVETLATSSRYDYLKKYMNTSLEVVQYIIYNYPPAMLEIDDALDEAVFHKKKDMVQYLLNIGARQNDLTLYIAIAAGDMEIYDLLVK